MNLTVEQLTAYFDNELDATERRHVELALNDDPKARACLKEWSAMDATLREALDEELKEPVPAWLLQAAEQAAPMMPANKKKTDTLSSSFMDRLLAWLPAPRFAAGFAIALLVGVFVGRDVLPRLQVDAQLVRLAAVAHNVYSPDKRRAVEVKSDDATLLTWLSKRLEAKVQAPDLAESGYKFIGGRLLAGAEKPAGQLMYEDAAGKRVTIFVRTEGAEGRTTPAECDAYKGVSVCYWYTGGVAYALAGEVSQAVLLQAAERVAPQK